MGRKIYQDIATTNEGIKGGSHGRHCGDKESAHGTKSMRERAVKMGSEQSCEITPTTVAI